MENHEIGERAEAILKAYRNHVENDLERAVTDIGTCASLIENEAQRRAFFTDFLSSKFGDEYVNPPRGPNDARPGFELIIRAWARYGPTDHLTAKLLSMLGFSKDQHNFWEREILPALRDALQKDGANFKSEVLKAIEDSMYMSGHDGSVRAQFETLARLAKQILYARFRETLGEPGKQASAKPLSRLVTNEAKPVGRDELRDLLNAVEVDPKLTVALRKCREYLDSSDPFHAKAAGDLLRSAIDSVNRSLVAELAKLTGVRYEGKDKDETRRQYFVKVRFMTEHEKEFFTRVYGLISNESNHQLDAPKETVLVMERTVTDYLILMLRRLLERKGGKLPAIGKGN